jgi:thiol-disulfide isomerase/thioredoxin
MAASTPVLIGLLLFFLVAFGWVLAYGFKYLKTGESFFGTFVKGELTGSEGFNNGVKIEYYTMNGCPHCQRFNPEWEKLVELAKKEGIETVKYDAREDRDKVSAAGVDGFPTIRIVRNGKAVVYEGARKADAILAEAKK